MNKSKRKKMKIAVEGGRMEEKQLDELVD